MCELRSLGVTSRHAEIAVKHVRENLRAGRGDAGRWLPHELKGFVLHHSIHVGGAYAVDNQGVELHQGIKSSIGGGGSKRIDRPAHAGCGIEGVMEKAMALGHLRSNAVGVRAGLEVSHTEWQIGDRIEKE